MTDIIYYKEQNKNIMKLTIPFYLHKVGAGFPSPATDYIEDDIDLNSHLITNAPATFIIRVQGKSMINVGIYDGDLLIVDKSINPRNFSTVIANVNEELVVKTLIKETEVSYLTSGSKDILDKINLTENPEIVVWGVVTYVIHKQQ
jgi:DNA polymerase V